MKQSYSTSTNLQNSAPQMYSFSINAFWFHVQLNGNVGKDQHGDRWFLRNDKLYSEFSYHIIDTKDCLTTSTLVA
jgi:hypothetical protein